MLVDMPAANAAANGTRTQPPCASVAKAHDSVQQWLKNGGDKDHSFVSHAEFIHVLLPGAEATEHTPANHKDVLQLACSACFTSRDATVRGRAGPFDVTSDRLFKHFGAQTKAERTAPHIASKSHGKRVSVILTERGTIVAAAVQRNIEVGVDGMSAAVLAQKCNQMRTVVFILQHGRPMTDFAAHKDLQQLLKVPHLASSHWSEGWELARAAQQIVRGVCSFMNHAAQSCCVKVLAVQLLLLPHQLLALHIQQRTCDRCADAQHQALAARPQSPIVITADEGTDGVQISHLSAHAYYVENWVRKALFLGAPHIKGAPTAENLLETFLTLFEKETGVTRHQLTHRLLEICLDGASVMQGCNAGFAELMRRLYAPYAQRKHCAAHRTQLALVTMNENRLFMAAIDLGDKVCTAHSLQCSVH